MMYEYTRRRAALSSLSGAPTFRVAGLKQTAVEGRPTIDLSHLLDGSYNYHSPRELRWHLADRLGVAPAALALREAALA